MNCLYLYYIVTIFSFTGFKVVSIPQGPNVCARHVPYTYTVQVTKQKPISTVYYGWCWKGIFPYRCTQYNVNFRTVIQSERLTKSKVVEECCEGYYEFDGICQPKCPSQCLHGMCVAPNECSCENGFNGSRCDIPDCPAGKYGKNCLNDCACTNQAICDPKDGSCACASGFIGTYCEHECPTGKYGQNCTGICLCKNGKCDHVMGACKCDSGWIGPLCDETCPLGTKAESCVQKCKCQNGGICHAKTGECLCTMGWTGPHCARPCSENFWGKNCTEACSCGNGAHCHHVTGDCECTPGFTGTDCHEVCPRGFFGLDCSSICKCKSGALCNHIDGACTYPKSENYERCPDFTWGNDCDRCNCIKNYTDSCDPVSGKCDCKAGWMGYDCSFACSSKKYGKNCAEDCRCINSDRCAAADGSCVCLPGYRGRECKDICHAGTYGLNCSQICASGNTCDPVTGINVCTTVGYTGTSCSEPCANGWYGKNCRMRCNCKNNATCHHISGECTCAEDWIGPDCGNACPYGTFGINCKHNSSTCPENFFGDRCNILCNCTHDNICDSKYGCICPFEGLVREDCTDLQYAFLRNNSTISIHLSFLIFIYQIFVYIFMQLHQCDLC